MDEIFGITEKQFKNPLPIPDGDAVYRQVFINDLDKESKRFPKANHFQLKEGEEELSVNWDALITLEEVYYIIGLSKNMKGLYKDYKQYMVFQFPVIFLRQLEQVEKVVHSPVFHDNPSPIGKPNIYAHASVYYPNDEETRKKLSNYCNDEFEKSYCNTNFTLLEPVVEELRQKLNTTKYHCCDKEEL